MKHLKMLGLAAIAALGLMAFVGAGTASATTLCTSVSGSACSVDYGVGQKYDGSLKSGTTARLTSGGSTIATCSASTVKGEQTNTSATWITIDITELTWPAANCSTTTDTIELAKGYFGKLTVMWTKENNGEVWADETEVTLSLFGTTCTYGAGAGTKLGTFTGGAEPILSISTTVNKTAGNFLCPGTAGWDAEYVLTEPHAVFAVN
jgi:hypothetical protein